ncbi:PaeR7I family type II restriction endonuclease [Paracoccus sp. FO-3]|uniref:PaeR7I family type II restriction endonuclease n=1 Tax=Paracoccaceae TaxID=31989 RepID=UPI003514D650
MEERGAIYAQRYDILCKRRVQEGLYSSATFLASPREAARTARTDISASLNHSRPS